MSETACVKLINKDGRMLTCRFSISSLCFLCSSCSFSSYSLWSRAVSSCSAWLLASCEDSTWTNHSTAEWLLCWADYSIWTQRWKMQIQRKPHCAAKRWSVTFIKSSCLLLSSLKCLKVSLSLFKVICCVIESEHFALSTVILETSSQVTEYFDDQRHLPLILIW